MNQPTKQQIDKLLLQILESPEFCDSKRYQDLLKYLVTKSDSVGSLKEAELAHDFFGKDSSFDTTTDPLIRSYVSNLRKKLEHYYLTTENLCEFRLEIPKGHYLVKYLPVEHKEESKNKIYYNTFIYLAIILILSSILVFREFTKNSPVVQSQKVSAPNPIWSNFLKQDSPPTLIVIGDYLVLSEKHRSDGRTFLRVPQINSEKELNDSVKTNPKKFSNLEISDVTLVGAAPSLGVAQLMEVFSGSSTKVSVKLSHDLKWDDFDNHNIIFIGTFKNLYKLDTLFSRTNIRYYLSPNSLKIIGENKDTIHAFDLNWLGGNYQKDYSVILKLAGSKNNSIMFLTGFSEVGVMDAIKSSIDPNLITRINNFSGSSNLNSLLSFELISEVEGLRYTVLGSKFKYFQNFRK